MNPLYLLSFIPALLFVIAGILAIRKSKKEKERFNMRMAWYFYYTYWLLPITAFILCARLFSPVYPLWLKICWMFSILLTAAVFYGLKELTKWGWWLNIGYITLACVSNTAINILSLANQSTSVGKLAVTLVFGLCNYVYFIKRKHLFS